jgi:hypothetical protein
VLKPSASYKFFTGVPFRAASLFNNAASQGGQSVNIDLARIAYVQAALEPPYTTIIVLEFENPLTEAGQRWLEAQEGGGNEEWEWMAREGSRDDWFHLVSRKLWRLLFISFINSLNRTN